MAISRSKLTHKSENCPKFIRDDKPNLIVEMTVEFAPEVTEFCDELDKLKKFRLSNQLFGSGTSIGANVREAQNAESK